MEEAARLRLFGLPASWAIIFLLLASGISRLIICTTIPILPDEAYYFQWSQHLDASYFSKGPAIAWTIWAGTKLFGSNLLGVRIFSVLLSVGTAWQVFLFARRWFDEETAVWSLLLLSVIPIYSLGAIVMTIDPLSAFFWVWAANLFTSGWKDHHPESWGLAGFAIASGFLAKYLNGLELLAILAFCLTENPLGELPTPYPPRQNWLISLRNGLLTLIRRNYLWAESFVFMLAVALVCSTPVFWWNSTRGWPTIHHLGQRANMNDWQNIDFALVWKFLYMQALVISPLLFLCLMVEAVLALWYWRVLQPGARLAQALFLSVFLFYFILAFHYVGEPNWPTISYLTLVILGAARIRSSLRLNSAWARFSVAAFMLALVLADAETVTLHATRLLNLPPKLDPFSRTSGWAELAGEVQKCRVQQGNPEMMADAYKEASVVTFYLPDQHFVYTIPNSPPSSQYDLWPKTSAKRVLYFTEDPTCSRVIQLYPKHQLLEHFQLYYRGNRLRSYYLFIMEN